MCVYQSKPSFVEKGDPQCEQKKRYEEYVNKFVEKGCLIATNIKTYEILITEKAENLFKVSPAFFPQQYITHFHCLQYYWHHSFPKGMMQAFMAFLIIVNKTKSLFLQKTFTMKRLMCQIANIWLIWVILPQG